MYDSDASTRYENKLVRQFQSDPIGMTVELDDGSHAVVSEFRDGADGRWLRLKRRGGPWVPQASAVAVRYTVARCLDPDAMRAGSRA